MHNTPETPSTVWTLNAHPDAKGARLDQYLARLVKQAGHDTVSREKLKKWIKSGRVRFNDTIIKKPSEKLPGPGVFTVEPDKEICEVEPEQGTLDILYEDDQMLVINKPAGLTVHPAPSCPTGTLAHILVHHYPALASGEPGTDASRPGIVHRIDKGTSGIMLVALAPSARLTLSEGFAQRVINKEYLAVVQGVPSPATADVDAPIGRHPTHKTRMAVVPKGGKHALSRYRVLYADPNKKFSLVAVRIHTGRTHQIRVHMKHVGHQLWGDFVYGGTTGPETNTQDDPILPKLLWRQLLHAWKIGFPHPASGDPMFFSLAPPRDFFQPMLRLSRTTQRIIITGMPGSGKSTVTDLLQQHGLPVWSADACVQKLYAPGGLGAELLITRYGEKFAAEDGKSVNKLALFAAMRTDDHFRRELEQMIHPMVNDDLEQFWAAHAQARAAVAEVPLWFETGWNAYKGYTVAGVHCPRKQRRARLAETRGWGSEMFDTLESWQWPEQDKMAACDLLVDNTSTLSALEQETRTLLKTLRLQRANRMRALFDQWQQIVTVNDTQWREP